MFIITTEACGAAEVLVKDDETGYVVEPGSAPALAEAMARLWSPTDRARLGLRARDLCIELCNPELEVKGVVEAVSRLRVKGLTGG
jgi:glycosyltransferase involved in cell wall biosynthesis